MRAALEGTDAPDSEAASAEHAEAEAALASALHRSVEAWEARAAVLARVEEGLSRIPGRQCSTWR